jgi:hypothetical protein
LYRLPSSSHNSNSSSSPLESPSSIQRSFSPIPSNLSSPIPSSTSPTIPTSTGIRNSQSTSYFGPSPTTHLNYETFASSSASNLSIKSFPSNSVISRSSIHDILSSTTSNKVLYIQFICFMEP